MANEVTVKKSTEYVHITNNMSLIQRRMVNVLLWNAYDHLLTREKHCITLSNLLRAIGATTTNNIDHIKQAFLALLDIKFEWNIMQEDEEEWTAVTAVSEVTIKNGMCYYSYAPTMREKLSNPKLFAKIDINLLSSFRSSYALPLYEFVLTYRNEGAKFWDTGYVPLEKLHRLLGTHNNASYAEFKVFNRDVLKRATKELCEVSPFNVELEFVREKRAVVAIRFLVESKEHESVTQADARSYDDQHINLSGSDPILVKQMQDFGLSAKQITKFITEIAADELKEIVQYVVGLAKKGKVSNITAFAYSALVNRYKPGKASTNVFNMVPNAEEQAQADKAQQEQEVREAKRKEYSSWKAETLQARYNELSADEQERYVALFVSEMDAFNRKVFEDNGFNSPLVQNSFKNYLSTKLLSDEECSFDTWLLLKR